MSTISLPPSFAEKDFYLAEFRNKSLLFALRAADLSPDVETNTAVEVLSHLLTNDTRVLLFIETCGDEDEYQRVRAFSQRLVRTAKIPASDPIPLSRDTDENQLLSYIWTVLRSVPVFIGLWLAIPNQPNLPNTLDGSLIDRVQRLAVRLKVYKLVLLDPAGGITTGSQRLSFINGPVLRELLRQGEAEWSGLGAHRLLLEAVHRALVALEGEVFSVTLCTLSNLAQELFTYEGCGTLFTLTDYCRVGRLGIDDFYEVERLIQRGEREGYLKKRSPQEVTQLLLHGYGARLGTVSGALAGFCALLPYPAENAGEVVGLYTLTRFQGEGVGGRLITTIIAEGERTGLASVFACTAQEGAQRLFERHGFHRVPHTAVPAVKWRAYDPERKQQIAVYKRALSSKLDD